MSARKGDTTRHGDEGRTAAPAGPRADRRPETLDQPTAPRRRAAAPLSEIAKRAIEPALLRRAGLTLSLLGAWPEIAGAALAARSRPLRVRWGRRPHLGADAAPGTLVIACNGADALRLQHQSDQVIERVNRTFGYRAIGRVAIEQRPIAPPPVPRAPPPAPPRRVRAIRAATEPIEHEALRGALRRLGGEVAARAASDGVRAAGDGTAPDARR